MDTRSIACIGVAGRYFNRLSGAALGLALTLGTPGLVQPSAHGAGADILYSNCTDTINHGMVGDIRAYSLGTHTCNIGDQSLSWISSGTPGCAFNLYRLHDGRLMQIGLGNVKTACCVVNGSGCGMVCQSTGFGLRAGCQDVYGASFNQGQSRLGPRSAINPYSGAFTSFPGTTGNAIFRRLQVLNSDLVSANFPNSLFFIEGVYVSTEDAQAGNRNNNASHKRVTIADSNLSMTLVGNMQPGKPAIYAWRDHGNGANMPDNTVQILEVDVPGEGRFVTATKVRDNGDGTWRYDYAVFNLSSHRAGGSLRIPVSVSDQVTNVGFNDAFYHSGEIYDNTDWTNNRTSTEMVWSSPQAFDQNPNSNAIRWATMYNFWFTSNKAPTSGQATLGLFRPAQAGEPAEVTFAAQVPTPGLPCPGNVVSGRGNAVVDADDLLAVINQWGPCVGCRGDIVPPGGNGEVNVDDLLLVINSWGPCP